MTSTAYEKVSELDLDAERFDQPPRADHRNERSYVICTTPRSGSWLYCRQLFNAGIGVPSEYFGIDHVNALYARWNVNPLDTRQYLKALREHRTTPNGVFGTKLLWAQFADRRTALKVGLLPHARLVYLYREDLVPQVVSLHLSTITGRWGFDATTAPIRRDDIPIGNEAHLAVCERMVVEQQRAWQDVFDSMRLRPLRLSYEALVADPAAAIRQLADLLGLAAHEYRIPPPEARERPFDQDIEAKRVALIAKWRDAVASRGAR